LYYPDGVTDESKHVAFYCEYKNPLRLIVIRFVFKSGRAAE